MISPAFLGAISLQSAPAPPSGDFVSTVLADSPIAWWRLQDSVTNGATAINEVTGGASGLYTVPSDDLAIQPGPPLVTGASKSYAKSGIGNAGMKAAAPNVTGDYSVESWFSCTGAGGSFQMLASIDYYVRLFQLRLESGVLTFIDVRSGVTSLSGGSSLIGTGRHQAVATVSSTLSANNMHLYLDGVLLATGQGTSSGAAQTDICVGCYQSPTDYPEYQFHGDLSDTILYGSNLTAARVLAHWNAGK